MTTLIVLRKKSECWNLSHYIRAVEFDETKMSRKEFEKTFNNLDGSNFSTYTLDELKESEHFICAEDLYPNA